MLRGVPASPGQAAGPARTIGAEGPPLPDAPAGAPEEERAALAAAREAVAADLRDLRASAAERAGAEAADIVDAQILLLGDEALVEASEAAIAAGAPAARAWDDAVRSAARGYEALDDEYLRVRATDLLDVGRRVLARLAGAGPEADDGEAAAAILVAGEVGAADAAGLDPDRVAGLATAGGGPTSHAAIIARALGIPAVAGLGPGILAVAEGTPLLLDGDAGAVVVAPDAEAVAAHEARRDETARARRRRPRARRRARGHAGRPPHRGRGQRRRRPATSSAPSPRAPTASASSAPSSSSWAATRPPTRTSSGPPTRRPRRRSGAGAWCCAPSTPAPTSRCPTSASRPRRTRSSACAGCACRSPAPSCCSSSCAPPCRPPPRPPWGSCSPWSARPASCARPWGSSTRPARSLADEGRGAGEVEVGAMVEVPAAALAAAALAAQVDFLSIGTNDLVQYTMAAERGNAGLARLSDPVHPAVLRLIAGVAEAASRHACRVAVCGEAASDPAAIPLLVGLGVDELSVAPGRVPLVKEAVRALDLECARRALVARGAGLEDAAAVRALVTAG